MSASTTSESEASGKRRRENSRSGESLQKLVSSGEEDPLCCCEYINDKGEKSHVLGFFCDCETLDDSFERLMQGQPQPKGRFKEICNVFSDRFRFPWINGARRVELESLLPAIVVPACMWLGTYGPFSTALSFILLIISLHVIRKCLLMRKRGTKFYCSFTITCFILSYLIFEFKVNSFDEVSKLDYWLYILLIVMTLSLMYHTKVKGREDRNLATISDKLPTYYYCRTCQFYVDGRDHHCVWLHCCIGKVNKPWFLTAIIVGCCWIIYTMYVTLRVVCDPVELFGGHIILPLSCSAVYENYDTAISFVSVIYGIIVLILLSMILMHQSRLVWRGVSYLDWRFSKPKTSEVKAKPQVAIT